MVQFEISYQGVIPKARAFTSGPKDLTWHRLRGQGLFCPIDQNAVPINLQVGCDANALRARRQLAGQVGSHGTRTAGREAHVIDDANPFAVAAQCLHVWRDRMHASLRCGIHAVGGKVFDFTVQQQPQRASAVRLAQIERESMRLGEAQKLRQGEVAEIAVSQQIGQNVVPMFIPRTGGRPRVVAGDDLEFGIRRIRSEIFVGIDVDIGRMINGQQANLVEVNGFLERLHEAEA